MPSPDSKPQIQFERVFRELQSILKRQPDIGVLEIISDRILERRAIFDPSSRRKPKPEVVIVFGYAFLLAVIFAAFNLK